jgi:hypothetical protein
MPITRIDGNGIDGNTAPIGGLTVNNDIILNRTGGFDNSIVVGTASNSENRNVIFQRLGGGAINGNWQFRGRVQTPEHPAFWARGSGTLSLSGASVTVKLVCDSLIDSSNRGSHYNTSTSRFTAPVAGYYAFYISSAPTTATSSGPALQLHKNGGGITEVAINYSNVFYTQFGGMCVISANAGDFFEPFISNYNSTSFTIDLSRTRFSGFFLG